MAAVFEPVDVQGTRLAPGMAVCFVSDKATGAVLLTGRVDGFTASAVRVFYPLTGPTALQQVSLIHSPATKCVVITAGI